MHKVKPSFHGRLAGLVWAMSVATALMAWQPARAGNDGAHAALTYQLHYGGFLIGTAELDLDLQQTSYRLSSRLRTEGLFHSFFEFTSTAESTGLIDHGKVQVRHHRQDNSWRGKVREVNIEYDPAGPVRWYAEPPAAQDNRDAVPNKHLQGSVDPLTATLQAALASTSEQKCQGTYRVFDGRRRYDLLFQPIGIRQLNSKAFSGQTMQCRLTYQRIAGRSRQSRSWWQTDEAQEDPAEAKIWFGPIAAGLPSVPIRIEADVGPGAFIMRLKAAQLKKAAATEGQAREG